MSEHEDPELGLLNSNQIETLDWDKGDGLLPAIVQHARTSQVLMLGYMSQQALAKTFAEQKVTFHSRSRNRLWQKGETSGNTLDLVEVCTDCDRDTILVTAMPNGPTCHTGAWSCFDKRKSPGIGFLAELEHVIDASAEKSPDQSYTARLLTDGVKRIAQKVGEEGVETALAAMTDDQVELLNESADLIYHLLVLLHAKGTQLDAVLEVLHKRHQG